MKKIFKYCYLSLLGLFILFLCFFTYEDITINEVKKVESEEVSIIEKADIPKVNEIKTYFVDIKGEVRKPGVYEVEADKRIQDVIKLAGGLTKNADTSLINLSKKVYDEMSIKIYSKKEISDAYNLVEPKVVEVIKEVEKIVEKECNCDNNCIKEENLIETTEQVNSEIKTVEEKTNNKVNINTATKEELLSISGIGETKAIKIIEYRNNNKFNSIEDIKNVSGIGDSLFEKIKDYITI